MLTLKFQLKLPPLCSMSEYFTRHTCIFKRTSINSLQAGKVFMFLSSADYFENDLFKKFVQNKHQGTCQTVKTQIRPDILSGLIWVQTVCKVYEQTTQAGKELIIMTYHQMLYF